jgi:hypothetical protein
MKKLGILLILFTSFQIKGVREKNNIKTDNNAIQDYSEDFKFIDKQMMSKKLTQYRLKKDNLVAYLMITKKKRDKYESLFFACDNKTGQQLGKSDQRVQDAKSILYAYFKKEEPSLSKKDESEISFGNKYIK